MKKSNAISRVYIVHPNNMECFHLRILLHIVKGPTRFEDLKIVDGIHYATFQLACQHRGLLQNDDQWNQTLEEAAISNVPSKLRYLFVLILSYCQVTDPTQLWINQKNHFCEDLEFRFLG